MEPRRQCNPLRKSREGRTSPLIPWGWELGSDGKVNESEPLINVVKPEQAKGIDRLEPKGKGARSQDSVFLCANNDTPAKRWNLTHPIWNFKQNLVSPYPSRKGKQPAREADGGADMRYPRKRRPPCNGTDSGNAVMRKHADFGLVFNHNNECGVKRKMSKGEQRNDSQKADVRIDSELDWNQINWQQIQDTVTRLQARIVKAQQEGRRGKVKSLTRILTHSFAAKALAVKKVSSNKGSHTPGVDGTVWNTNESKAQAILELKQEGYRAKPLRRKYIPKAGSNKLRPLGIPTMKDRAMQAVYASALEPVAETTGDPNSYGFRPYRSCQDAIDHIGTIMRRSDRPQWILEGDIKGCFDNISHDWMLKHIPMETSILKQWLKCGYFENDKKFFNETGTPQGGIISPILANMVLDGLQNLLYSKYKNRYQSHKNGKFYWTTPKHKGPNRQVNLIRYADDFIITCNSKEVLEAEIKPMIRIFLQERGLELSEEKTVITNISDGFDFLGFNIKLYNDIVLVKPAGKRVKRIRDKIGEIISTNQAASAEKVIEALNPVIRGWCNYYRFVNSTDTFDNLSHWIWGRLWQWTERRHHDKGKQWRKNRYFTRLNGRDWRFFAKKDDGSMIYLTYPNDIKMLRHKQIRIDMNPYDANDAPYFEERKRRGVKLHLPNSTPTSEPGVEKSMPY